MKLNFTLLLVLFTFCLTAQEAETKEDENEGRISNKTSIGFQLSENQGDFGTGLTITSPFFLKNKLAVRLSGNVMFFSRANNPETAWDPYGHLALGLVSASPEIKGFLRLYSEFGFIGVIPNQSLTDDRFKLGGYGLFGFEFYMSPNSNYFIELGGQGVGTEAEKLDDNPIFSNGFMINVGFRAHFK